MLLSPAQAQAAVEAFSALVGTISTELFGQLGADVREQPSVGAALLASIVAVQADRMGLPA